MTNEINSDIGRWAQCETLALHGAPRRSGRQLPVSDWVHRIVMSHLRPARTALTGKVAFGGFDRVTPTSAVGLRQASAMAEAALSALEENHACIDDKQPADRSHLLASTPTGGVAIEIVTDDSVGSAWLRIGGVCAADVAGDLSLGAVLHVPRRQLTVKAATTMELRRADQLADAYRALSDRREQVVARGAHALRTPGTHCAQCAVADCAVRSERSA